MKPLEFHDVCVAETACVYPPEVITSAQIEQELAPLYERLKLPEGRLELMTGIRERRFWPAGMKPSDASAEAGRRCLEQSNVDPGEIDLLVHCAVCRDRLEPATAAYVHELLGLAGHCQIFDISNACLGFLNGLMTAAAMIQSGQVRHALVVSGENGRPLLERTLRTLLDGEFTRKTIKPYFANLTIGAGSVAFLLSRADLAKRSVGRPQFAVVETDSSANRLCQGDTSGHELEMLTEAELLLEAGLKVAARAWKRFLAVRDWDPSAPDLTICHQVGRTHQRRLLESLERDPERDFITYPEMGNVGSVSLPLTLVRAIEAGALRPGQTAALLGIGSGLSCVMMCFERDAGGEG